MTILSSSASNKPSRNKQVIIESLSFFNNQESDTGYEKGPNFLILSWETFVLKLTPRPTPRGGEWSSTRHRRRGRKGGRKKGFLIKSFVPLAIYASVSGPARKWKEERAKMGLQFSSGETFPDIHVAVVVVVVVSLLSWNGAGGIDLGGPLRKFTNWRVMLWLWRCKHTLIGGFMKYESCGKCRVAFVFTNTQMPKPFRMWAVTKADPYIISKAMHAWGCGNISVHLLSLCVRRIGWDTSHVSEEGERKSSFSSISAFKTKKTCWNQTWYS